MLRVMCATLVLAVVTVLAPADAGTADRASSIAPHADAPVVLTAVRTRIYNGISGTPDFTFDLCASYDPVSVRALRYHVTAIDAFGGALRSETIDDKGDPPAPNIGRLIISQRGLGPYLDPLFTRCISVVNPFPSNAARFVVALDAVALEDGTVWRAKSP